MIPYFIVVGWVLIFGALQSEYAKFGEPMPNGEPKVHNSFVYILPLAGIFIFVGGLRYGVGTDYWAYYKLGVMSQSALEERFWALDEPLIHLLTNIARTVWDEGIFVIFVEQAITIILIFRGLRDHNTRNYTLPLLLYMFYCGWLFTFNGVRQGMAVALIFAFSAKKGKYWYLRYIAVCFIAFLIHKTALLVIPFLLLSVRKYDWKQILVLICAGLAIYLGGDLAYTYMGGTAENVGEYATNDINIIRVFVAVLPAAMCLLTLYWGYTKFIEQNNLLINLVSINAVVTIATMGSAYLNRFSYYTVIFNMLLIPKLEVLFDVKSKKIYEIAVFVLFFIYFLYETRNQADFAWAFGHFGKF